MGVVFAMCRGVMEEVFNGGGRKEASFIVVAVVAIAGRTLDFLESLQGIVFIKNRRAIWFNDALSLTGCGISVFGFSFKRAIFGLDDGFKSIHRIVGEVCG